MTDPPVRVCVVGAGPRGLSALERLCADAGDKGMRASLNPLRYLGSAAPLVGEALMGHRAVEPA